MVVRLARLDVAGTVLLTVSWFQAVCRSRSALRVHLARAVDWCCGLADGRPQLRTRWIGWRREEQFRRLPGTTRGLLFLVVVSGPCLVCVVADGAAATGRLRHPLLVAESFVLPTKFSGTMYKAANWECVGRGHARASGRYTDRGGEGSLRVSAASRCRLRDRSPLPVAWELRAPLVGAGVALDLSAALSDFRRAQGHRIASVLCVILLACEPARLRRRTTR